MKPVLPLRLHGENQNRDFRIDLQFPIRYLAAIMAKPSTKSIDYQGIVQRYRHEIVTQRIHFVDALVLINRIQGKS